MLRATFFYDGEGPAQALAAARGAARGGAVKLEPHICSREHHDGGCDDRPNLHGQEHRDDRGGQRYAGAALDVGARRRDPVALPHGGQRLVFLPCGHFAGRDAGAARRRAAFCRRSLPDPAENGAPHFERWRRGLPVFAATRGRCIRLQQGPGLTEATAWQRHRGAATAQRLDPWYLSSLQSPRN